MFKLTRLQRLTSKRLINRVFENASVRYNQGPLHVVGSHNQSLYPRIGITVPKRVERNAVKRNRLKRVIREWFRLHQGDLPVVDLFVMVRIKPISETGVLTALDMILVKLETPDQRESNG